MNINKFYMLICFLLFLSMRVYGIEKQDSLFKVLKIKKKGSYYIVHAQRQDSLFKIISKNVPLAKKASFEQLKKGKYYYFDFEKITTEVKAGSLRGIANNMDVDNKNVFVDGDVRIKFTRRFHYRLYTTENLIGLFYIPND